MKKKVIIGIHGLGNKPSKRVLNRWWKKSMKEGLTRIGVQHELPKFDMIYWADVLHEKPASVKSKILDDPNLYLEPYSPSPKNYLIEDISTRKKIIGFLGKQLNEVFLNENLDLNYSFITDYILNNYFKELSTYYHEVCYDKNKIECMAKDLIRMKAVKTLKKYQDHDIILVAHSMGSIIAFDVLTFLLPILKINTFVTMGSPLGLPIVISKIAAEHKINEAGKAIMRTPPGVKKNWYNFSDLYDNIAFNYLLNDDFKENNNNVSVQDFLVLNDYMIGETKNPHKSFGYLRTKEFAHVLTDFIED